MSNLSEQVYDLLRQVPKGNVTTYKALADAVGTKAYRQIGQIMKKNPDAPNTPCHRCVSSDGNIGGFNGQTDGEDIKRKINLLRSEGVIIKDNKISNFDEVFYSF